MATTKIGGGLVDLNSDNTALKMPVGSGSFTGTPVAGMIRNNSSLSNGTAQTSFEYYDGTQWVGMAAPTPPDVTANFMVLAGGGSGGRSTTSGSGGGAGAGGLRTSYGPSGGDRKCRIFINICRRKYLHYNSRRRRSSNIWRKWNWK